MTDSHTDAGQTAAADGRKLPPAAQSIEPEGAQALADRIAESVAQHTQRSLQFSVDEDSGRTVIKVIDRDTGSVLRQIPTEEMLAISRRLEASAGFLIAEQA
ncbi:MAG: flagellar protein FlaG [Gammaproteobacteria bacterium]